MKRSIVKAANILRKNHGGAAKQFLKPLAISI